VTAYVVAGYTVSLGGLVAYAAWVLLREHALKRDAPGENAPLERR
jgi:hypothetical protein